MEPLGLATKGSEALDALIIVVLPSMRINAEAKSRFTPTRRSARPCCAHSCVHSRACVLLRARGSSRC